MLGSTRPDAMKNAATESMGHHINELEAASKLLEVWKDVMHSAVARMPWLQDRRGWHC